MNIDHSSADVGAVVDSKVQNTVARTVATNKGQHPRNVENGEGGLPKKAFWENKKYFFVLSSSCLIKKV